MAIKKIQPFHLDTDQTFQFGNVTTLGKFIVSDKSDLGSVSNITITGGNSGYVLSTDGTGNLSWIEQSVPLIPGGTNTQVQFNSANTFAGSANFTFDVTTNTLSVTNIVANGSQLTDLNASNVTGQVSNAVVSGTVYTNAQPNITSLGTLTDLTVTGNTNTGNLRTDNILYANGDPYVFTTNPAGSNTQIQFNDSGSFQGSANLTFNKTTNTLATTNVVASNNITSLSGNITLDTGIIAVDNNQAGIFTTTITTLNIGLVANITLGSTTGNTTVRGNLIANSIINSGNLTALDGTITNLKVNDFYSNRTPVTVTANTIIDSFSINKYRSAKYTIRVNSDDGYQAVEVLLIHNGISSFVTVYGSLSTIGTDIVTLSTDLNSGNVRLLATTVAANTTVNLLGTYVAD
jgi:hypothetical protein